MSWRNRNNKNKNMNLIEMFNKQILLDKTPLWKDHLIPFYPIDKNYFKINNNKYDIDSLKNDLLKLETDSWINKDGKTDEWTSITLKSYDGYDQSFIKNTEFGRGNNNKYQYTPYMENCNYFKKVLDEIPTDVYLVRILKLKKNGRIKFHTDEDVFKDRKIIRIHLPIITNPDVKFQIGYPVQKPAPGYNIWNAQILHEKYLEPGYLWFTNVNTLHGVENKGTTDRYHMVIDIRNPFLK